MNVGVAWEPWSDAAFERAQREDKPILLSISAVWCHWCHVMDKTTYGDDEIAAYVNEQFVPVRVDNDRRPDVNARYNQGGWPTTAFLTPDGSVLTGATYLPPEQMRGALHEIVRYYTENRDHITQRIEALKIREKPYELGAPGDLNEAIVTHVAEAIEQHYDDAYGGFGTQPKFPMTDVLEFLLLEYRLNGTQRSYDMVAKSMLAMSGGGMYDHVEGGFFRYSTTRDWSVPHFEKMAEDHAGLLRLLAQLYLVSHNDAFRTTLVSATRYIRETFFGPKTLRFAGSQDADEEYYALPLEERRARTAPYIDRTSYSNWTAALAGALFVVAHALDDDDLAIQMQRVLDALHDTMRDSDGLLYHYVDPGGTPQVRGLLTDQSAYLRASIDAHEYTGEPRFLERAHELADAIAKHFGAPDAGFYDHAAIEAGLGRLDVRDRPLTENASLADSLLRLSVLLDEPAYRTAAEQTLLLYRITHERVGTFAAPYARAVRRYLHEPVSVTIVGGPDATAALREAALALPDPLVCVEIVAAENRAALKRRGLVAAKHPAAYICAGRTCGPPVREPADLAEAYASLAG